MEQIKIGLASLAPLLSDLVEGIVAEQLDMEIVATFAQCEDWLTEVDVFPDILVVGINNSDLSASCEKLLTEHPRTLVVGVTDDARRAYLYELRPWAVPLGEVSPHGLVDVIRAAVREGTSTVQGASSEGG